MESTPKEYIIGTATRDGYITYELSFDQIKDINIALDQNHLKRDIARNKSRKPGAPNVRPRKCKPYYNLSVSGEANDSLPPIPWMPVGPSLSPEEEENEPLAPIPWMPVGPSKPVSLSL